METDFLRSWKEILEQLSERRPPARLNVLDTIALERLGVCRPLFWASTSPQGYFQPRTVRALTVGEVIQAAVSNLQPKDSRECLALALLQDSRQLLTVKDLSEVSELVAAGLEGLVFLRSPGHKFDRRVFAHEIRMVDRGYEDTVQVLTFPELKETGESLTQSPAARKKRRPKPSSPVFV